MNFLLCARFAIISTLKSLGRHFQVNLQLDNVQYSSRGPVQVFQHSNREKFLWIFIEYYRKLFDLTEKIEKYLSYFMFFQLSVWSSYRLNCITKKKKPWRYFKTCHKFDIKRRLSKTISIQLSRKWTEERVQCISEILALGATSAYFSRNLLYVCPAPFNFPVEAAAEWSAHPLGRTKNNVSINCSIKQMPDFCRGSNSGSTIR